MQMIDQKLMQDTLNYLTTKPWAEVQVLINRWDEALKEEKKVEEEEDAGK
jgi:hypothetical protein